MPIVSFSMALLAIQQYPQIGHVRSELSTVHRIFPAGRYTRIAYFHAVIFGQIYPTCKNLILLAKIIVRKVQNYRTDHKSNLTGLIS